jgi:hypothetical protein
MVRVVVVPGMIGLAVVFVVFVAVMLPVDSADSIRAIDVIS